MSLYWCMMSFLSLLTLYSLSPTELFSFASECSFQSLHWLCPCATNLPPQWGSELLIPSVDNIVRPNGVHIALLGSVASISLSKRDLLKMSSSYLVFFHLFIVIHLFCPIMLVIFQHIIHLSKIMCCLTHLNVNFIKWDIYVWIFP